MAAWNSVEVSAACNRDVRFVEAGWQETPESIEKILNDPSFRERLAPVTSARRPLQLGELVAAVYRARIAERGARHPVRPGGRPVRKRVPFP